MNLVNTDFDTGRPAAYGEYKLADETYADLLKRLEKRRFLNVPPDLRRDIKTFYARAALPKKVQKRLAALDRAGAAVRPFRLAQFAIGVS